MKEGRLGQSVTSIQEELAIVKRQLMQEKEKNHRLKIAMDYCSEGIFIMEPVWDTSKTEVIDFRFFEVNPPACELLGMKREAILNQVMCEIVPACRTNGHLERYLKVYNTGKAIASEYLYLDEGNNVSWLYQSAQKTETGLVVTSIDVSERKNSEAELRKFKHIITHSHEAIVLADLNGEIVYANPSAGKLYGYEPKSLVGRNVDIFNAKQTRETNEVIEEIAREGAWAGEFAQKKADGTQFTAYLSVSLIYDENEVPIGLGSHSRDITDEKESAKKHKAQHNFLRKIIDLNPNLIFAKNKEGVFTLANKAVADVYGTTVEGLLGKTDADFNPNQEEVEWFIEHDRKVIENGVPEYIPEELLTDNDGNTRYLQTVKIPLSQKDEQPDQILGVATDITELKEAEQALVLAKNKLEAIMESTQDIVFALDKEYNYLAFNQNHFKTMNRVYGIEIKIGTSILDYMKNEHGDEVKAKQRLDRALKGDQFVEVDEYGNQELGRTFFEVSLNPIRNEKGEVKGVAVFVRDITDKKRSEDTLRRQEELLSSINHNIKEAIYRSTMEGKLVYMNSAFVEMFGYSSAGDMQELDIVQLYADPDERANLQKTLLEEGSLDNKEILFRRKDGSTFWGLISTILAGENKSSGAILFDGAIRDISRQKLAEEKLLQLNKELTNRNFALALQEEKLATSNAQLRAKQRELEQALEQLSDKNLELDQMMYRTSHDIRSPLTTILGLINIIHIEEDPKKILEYVGMIQSRTLKLDSFVKSMLLNAKSNRKDNDVEFIDLEELVNSCLADLEYLENYPRMEISLDIIGDKAAFYSDPLRIQIIFSNIISNAFKYMNLKVSPNKLNIRIALNTNETTILFEDNGIGISNDYLDKIFDMFFRASVQSDGSGLGLYIVKQSVERLGGEINVKSQIDKGTRIEIRIPKIFPDKSKEESN